MAQSAAGASAVSAPTGAQSGGGAQNPFQIATNLYAEQNVQAQFSGLLTTSANQQGGSVNAGQYLRGVRLIFRTTAVGVTPAGAPTVFDWPFSAIQNADLVNVDGSEILYNMSGYAHSRVTKYFRPWLQDPDSAYDTAAVFLTPGISAMSFTLFLQPEIRFTAGVLANTDTRSQYRLDYTLAPGSGATSPWVATSWATQPTVSVLPYMDAWAQPDGNDLQGTPNQPVPPGVNLQNKRRHQFFTLNAGGDNTLLSTLTGNALRGMLLITRNAAGARVNGLSTANGPFYWTLDNRSLGKLTPDIMRQWANDFYTPVERASQSVAIGVNTVNAVANAATYPVAANQAADTTYSTSVGVGNYVGDGANGVGEYVFPRWIEPGALEGQGWLYTANSTKLQFESVTTNSATTAELISDEVYPVGAIDPSLIDI